MDLEQDLNEYSGYINFVNESLPTLVEQFEIVKNLINKPCSDENFNTAFQSFAKIVQVIPLMVSKLEIPQIVRGRKNNVEHPFFTEEWELSYNLKFAHLIPLGRFNQEAEPLFYGSLPTENKDEDYVLSCALECCKELTDKTNPVEVQDITVGGWLVKEPFMVINLCFDALHLNDNPSLKNATNRYLQKIADTFSADVFKFIEIFLGYFSELSRTKNEGCDNYYITTALFVAIRWHYKERENTSIYGLIYPAAMSDAKGLNIVLTRDAVDMYLKLDKVIMYRYCIVKPERDTYFAEPCSAMSKVINHQFTITGYRPKGVQ